MQKAILKTRIDKYLWAIRIFKTRSLATKACDVGKVKWNGEVVKPSRAVQLNDVYEIKLDARFWKIKVIGIIEHRLQYADAIKNYNDLTPEEMLVKQQTNTSAFIFNSGKRQTKQGRPTKKQRRNLDEFRDEEQH